QPGDSFSFTITVTNNGDATAHDVVVTDTLPAGLTITSVSGPNCSVVGQTATCNVGDLAPGASVEITINVTADEGACPSVTNQATVTFDQGDGSVSVGSNPVTVGVNCQPDVGIVKNADAPGGGVVAGESFSYTITVTNNGTGTAHNVIVTDTVPDGLTIDSVDGPNCSVNGQTVTCLIGDLGPGESVTITINVTATEDACPSVTNTATVTHDEGSAESNPVTVTVDCVEGGVVTPTPTPTVGGVAFTGAGSAGLGLLALALLVLGSGLLYLGRRTLGDSDA
ncbi:MAG: COG1361 S-layer family protein, partial [Actinomycetota bacterium]